MMTMLPARLGKPCCGLKTLLSQGTADKAYAMLSNLKNRRRRSFQRTRGTSLVACPVSSRGHQWLCSGCDSLFPASNPFHPCPVYSPGAFPKPTHIKYTATLLGSVSSVSRPPVVLAYHSTLWIDLEESVVTNGHFFPGGCTAQKG